MAGPCALADTLFSRGYYSSAVLEYKRCRYSGSDSTGLLGLKLGLALGAAGELEPAVEQLHKTADRHPDQAYAAGMALAGFLSRNRVAGRARLELLDALVFTEDSSRRSRLYSALAWLDLADGNESGAAEYLEKSGEPELALEVRRAAAIPGRNPAVAALLSTFVPGAGETYAGRPLFGLSSLVVTGGSAAGAYLAAKSNDWVTAAVVFSFLFLRFYSGSRRNAADFCSDYREEALSQRLAAIARQHDLEPDWFAPAESLTGLRPSWPDSPVSGTDRTPRHQEH